MSQDALTDREQEILVCLADGLSNQEIANRLHLAEKTVRWYNSQIYGKLGAANREEAVGLARALSLLPDVSVAEGKHNLPAQATPFVGRRNELDELAALLDEGNTRLLTILAPGGMGKTRLGLEAARHQIGRYADGVFFVPLAPLSNPNDIVTAIAEVIGFVFYGDSAPQQQLIDFLRDRAMLLVLDNFEHLLEGASLVADLIQAAPKVKVLATSRERLNLHGETVYSLRRLDFPTWETPDDAIEYDAVRLFMQSAQRARPDFELESDHLDYLARICRLTEGMPLGIELAAGWVDVLSLEQIANEIQRGIDILETELRDVPERQRSIRATFEQTWKRLSDDQQAIFGRLSVFRGGFTLAAAQAVAGANARHLRGLAQKALILAESSERFTIHELLRQFGAGKLAETGELPAIQARHATFFADFMAARKQDIKTNRQLEALALIDPDFENVRTAWLHTVDQGAWEQLPKFLHSLWFYCDVETLGQVGVEFLQYATNALQSVSASAATELALGRVLARLGWFQNDVGFSEKGAATCDEAICILRQQDSPEDLIAALYERMLTASFLNELDIALSTTREGLRIAQAVGDKYWQGYHLVWMGSASVLQGDFDHALQCGEMGLSILRELGNQWGLIFAYDLLGRASVGQGNFEKARQWFEQAGGLADLFDHVFSKAMRHVRLSELARLEREHSTARAHMEQALKIFWDGGYNWIAPVPLVYIAQISADQNDLDRAVEVLAAIDKYSVTFDQTDQTALSLREELEARLEPDRFAAAWARGQARELGALVAELLAGFVDEQAPE